MVSGSYKAINRELEDGAKVRVEETEEDEPRRRSQRATRGS